MTALARIAAVRPMWTAVRSAREALGLEGRVLLHAGPETLDAVSLPPPMRNSALLSCRHEGWRLEDVSFAPSFTRSVATPLVAMVSPSTTVAEIASGNARYYAFLGTGGGPQQRFGSSDPAILERLAFRECTLKQGFTELLDAPVDLLAIARAAIREGDDLHNRLSSATTLLHALLCTRKADSPAAKAALQTVLEAPLYFLNLWMPACQLMLRAAEGEKGSTLVTRLCANGRKLGIQVAGLPGQWFMADATPVQGPFMKGAPENPLHPPATGDSGIIDAFGLGGQGLRHAPSLLAAFCEYLEPDDDSRARGMLAGFHPILETPFGLDAAAVARTGRSPLLSTGMVSADGRGLLGRGLCTVSVEPFARAADRLAALGA
ncbi:MAG: oxamate carbamoyltransferase subunit AllG family protein [Betaproteobacteria bacterium]